MFIASTHTQEYQGEWGSDSSIDNKLSWAGISVIHDAFELSRQAKLRAIKMFCESQQKPKPLLKVCFSETRTLGDNCCRCEKCLRTITGLLIEGDHIQDYGFDISEQEALTLIREKFRAGSMPLNENGAFFWKDLQARTREVFSSLDGRGSNEDNLTEFYKWLKSIDMDEY